MKRKFLEDLGIEKETIDKILDENSKDIGAAKKAESDAVKAELDAVKATLQERSQQLETLKKTAGDNAELASKIAALQEENKTKDAELLKVRRSGMDDLLLTEAKAKNLKAVKALLDEIEEADDDKYRAARADQIKKLVEGEDTKFLFGTESIKGTEPGNGIQTPPGGKPDFSKMGYDAIAEYMNAHPDAVLE